MTPSDQLLLIELLLDHLRFEVDFLNSAQNEIESEYNALGNIIRNHNTFPSIFIYQWHTYKEMLIDNRDLCSEIQITRSLLTHIKEVEASRIKCEFEIAHHKQRLYNVILHMA